MRLSDDILPGSQQWGVASAGCRRRFTTSPRGWAWGSVPAITTRYPFATVITEPAATVSPYTQENAHGRRTMGQKPNTFSGPERRLGSQPRFRLSDTDRDHDRFLAYLIAHFGIVVCIGLMLIGVLAG